MSSIARHAEWKEPRCNGGLYVFKFGTTDVGCSFHGQMSPKPEIIATGSGLSPANSIDKTDNLTNYIKFLTSLGPRTSCDTHTKHFGVYVPVEMAAIFAPENPASPLHYSATQTALLLLDFQGLVIKLCGPGGTVALAKATMMRDWALKQGLMIVHSVVDVHAKPPVHLKGYDRVVKMFEAVKDDREASEEPREIAFSQQKREYVCLKPPSAVSGLKSHGAKELLAEHDIKSLVICGLSSSGAVLRTATAASDDGFVVTVIEDACSDPKEGVHDMIMSSILPNRAHVSTVEEFMGEWEKAAKT